MFNDTITLFNYEHTIDGDKWHGHIIHGADVIVDKASVIAKLGENASDTAKVHIHYVRQSGEIFVDGIKYVLPKEYARLEDKADVLTFTESKDFVFLGEYEELEIDDEDYQTSKVNGFYEYMNSHYDHVYAITKVALYKEIPHFEIMAK